MLKCLNEVLNKLQNLVKVTKFVSPQKDGNNFYNAQLEYLGMSNEGGILYPYGLFANPPANAMGVTFNIMADQTNQVTIPFHPLKRFTGLKPGEVIVGNADTQTSIKFDEDGNVTISSKGTVTIEGDLVVTGNMTSTGDMVSDGGDLTVSGNIVATGDVSAEGGSLSMSDIQDAYNIHTHITDGDLSTPPDPPI